MHALLEADGNLTWVYGMPTCNVIYPSSHIHWNPLDPSYGLQCATQYLVDAQWYTARCDWDFKHFICERTESKSLHYISEPVYYNSISRNEGSRLCQ